MGQRYSFSLIVFSNSWQQVTNCSNKYWSVSSCHGQVDFHGLLQIIILKLFVDRVYGLADIIEPVRQFDQTKWELVPG